MHEKYTPCTYVSVWDDDVVVGTSAKFDPETKEVFDIEQANLPESILNGLNTLTHQYICIETTEGWIEYDVYEDDGRYFTIEG